MHTTGTDFFWIFLGPFTFFFGLFGEDERQFVNALLDCREQRSHSMTAPFKLEPKVTHLYTLVAISSTVTHIAAQSFFFSVPIRIPINIKGNARISSSYRLRLPEFFVFFSFRLQFFNNLRMNFLIIEVVRLKAGS